MNRFDFPDPGPLQPGDRVRIVRSGVLGGSGDDMSIAGREMGMGPWSDFFGHVAGNTYPPYGITGVTSGTAPGANILAFSPFIVKQRIVVSQLTVRITTSSGGGNLILALYAANPTNKRPGLLIDKTGAISTTSTGAAAGNLGAAQTLEPGLYWTAMLADNGTVAVNAVPGSPHASLALMLVGDATLGSIVGAGLHVTGMIGDSTYPTVAPDAGAGGVNLRFTTNPICPIVYFKVDKAG